MRERFHQRVALQNGNGFHVRYIPASLAASMVADGSAAIADRNGRVKSIKLLQSASTHGVRVGEASAATVPTGTRFIYRQLLESGAKVWTFRPLPDA